MNHKWILIFAVLLIASVAQAEVLVSSSVDKQSISTDEVAMLTIRLLNDSDKNIPQFTVRVTADDGIIFVEETEEKTVLAKTITGLNSGKGIELKAKLKAVSTKNPSANIYVYYGETADPKTANVIQIETIELPVTVKATAEKKSYEGGDKVIITFKLTNFSKENIYQINAGIIIPNGFEANEVTISAEIIKPNESLEKTFEVISPLDTRGTQTITLSYGYFDSNTPHYFEKTFQVDFQKPNYDFLVLIGFIVLAIAVYIFIKKDKKTEIKGTEEKKK